MTAKTKLPAILATAIVIALISLLVWKFWPMETTQPGASAPKPAPLPTAASPESALGMAVEAPKTAPVAPEEPQKASGDPQTEIHSAITDMIGLLQSGDYTAYFLKYGITPDDWAAFSPETRGQTLNNLQNPSPKAQQSRQNLLLMMGYLQGLTPVYNTTGDEATYQFTPAEGTATVVQGVPHIYSGTYHFVFKKVDGRWYLVSQGPGIPSS